MNQISSWSIKNPIPVILLFIILTLAGTISFTGMRINNNPDIDFPLVQVSAGRPGAAPAEMYESLTQRLARVPDEAVLYPGHQYSIESSATMGITRERNMVFRPKSREQWLAVFGG